MNSSPKGTVYYVDLINMPGGGGGGGDKTQKGGSQQVREPQRMKDLTTRKEEVQSKFRYPDQDKKSKKKSRKEKKKPEKKELITMTRKDRNKTGSPVTVSRKGDSNVVKTGISAGSGGGSGGGYGGGSGGGYGPGSGSGFFPYAYYIETLRNKVSSSWYSGLVSPGQRGQFLVVVDFKILRNGQVQDLKISQNSGIRSLDLSALRAVENSAPFPPLPGDYPYSYLPISFDFVWGKK
jgi:TonB family protein